MSSTTWTMRDIFVSEKDEVCRNEVYSFQGTWTAIIIYKSVLEKATGDHLMAKPIVV